MPPKAMVDGVPLQTSDRFFQSLNMGSIATSSTPFSESVSASQVQDSPQPQGSSSNVVHTTPTALNTNINASASSSISSIAVDRAEKFAPSVKSLIDDDMSLKSSPSNGDAPTSSTTISVGIDGEVTNQVAHLQSTQSVPNVANHPSATTSITTDRLNLQVPNGKTFNADSASTFLPSLDISNPLSPKFGTQTITANSEPHNILHSGLILSKSFASNHGSGTSTTLLAPQTFATQPFVASDSVLSYATTVPTLSKKPSFLTMDGQTVTAESLGRYSIDSQPLTKGGMATVSGTTISLAPNESHINVGTSMVAFGPSVTAKFGSGPNGTDVQRFNGNALGARDGLWRSSMILLVSFVVLLWL